MSRLPGKGAEGFRTLRRYGQNFLVDRGVLEDIVRRAAIGKEDFLNTRALPCILWQGREGI